VQIETAFVDAYSRHDTDLAASYLSAELLDAFGTGDWGSGVTSNGLEGMKLESQWQASTGFQTVPGACEVRSSSSSGTTVVCPYEYQGLRSEALGLGPCGGSYYDLRVANGEIVRISDAIAHRDNGFSEQVWEPFADWVADLHPDDVTVLYTDKTQSLQRISEESIPSWEQRTSEYVESGG
jgi:hypothetical protein